MKAVQARVAYNLPQGSQIKVVNGEKVLVGTVLAEFPRRSIKLFELAKILGVKRKKAVRFLKKKIGQRVEKGEILASKKGLLGKEKVFLSPLQGEIEALNERGILKIVCSLKPGQVLAEVAGEVVVETEREIQLAFRGYQLRLKKVIAKPERVVGKIMILKEVTSFKDLNSDLKDKILIYPGLLGENFLNKAWALGVTGLVVKEIDQDLCAKIEEELKINWFSSNKLSCCLGLLAEEESMVEMIGEAGELTGCLGIMEKEKRRLLIPAKSPT